jgi:hypothetical protein
MPMLAGDQFGLIKLSNASVVTFTSGESFMENLTTNMGVETGKANT